MSHFLFSNKEASFMKVAFEYFSNVLCLVKYFFACSTLIPSSLKIAPLYSAIPINLTPSSSVRNFDRWYPTFPNPCRINDLVERSLSSFICFKRSSFLKNSLTINCTPLPVASSLPSKPFLFAGLPVTHAAALMSEGLIFLYSSAIHAISADEVPISGAGTFIAGLIKSLFISSCANLLVIFSISFFVHWEGSIFRPPFEPPKGTLIIAFL